MHEVPLVNGPLGENPPWTCTEIPGQENMTLDIADGHVVGSVFVKSFLAQEKKQGNLIRDFGRKVELDFELFDNVRGLNREC
jgi:hypothetical protein